jgi:hypothetical protein
MITLNEPLVILRWRSWIIGTLIPSQEANRLLVRRVPSSRSSTAGNPCDTDASSIQSSNPKCIDGDMPMPYFARSENRGVKMPLGLPSFDEHMEQVPPHPHAGLAIRSNSDPGPSKLTSSLKRSIGELSPLQTAIESARRRKKARSAPTSPVKCMCDSALDDRRTLTSSYAIFR